MGIRIGVGILAALMPASGFAFTNVLITSFEPFANRSKNLSNDVAKAVEFYFSSHPEKQVLINRCEFPVSFEKIQAAVVQCLAQQASKPDFILSLGEGYCDLRIETVAHNTREGGEKILPSGPDTLNYSFPPARLYCALPTEQRKNIVISQDAGTYLCNYLSFYLLEKLKSSTVPFSFMHVPPESCGTSGPSVAESSQWLARMIEFNFPAAGALSAQCISEFAAKQIQRAGVINK